MFKGILLTGAMIASATFAENTTKWASADFSNWSLCHKQYLTWEERTLDDKIQKQFFMAYVQYRAGDLDEAHRVFEVVDSIIKREAFNPLCQQ